MNLTGAISKRSLDHMTRGSLIRAMFERGRLLKEQVGAANVHDYSLGNPFNEPPPALVQAAQRMWADPRPGMHRYMSNVGFDDVREQIAASLNARHGLTHPLNKNHVIMSCGAAGALNVVLKGVLDPGDEVLVPRPYFVEYDFYVDNHNGVINPVETDANFLPDLNKLEAAIGPRTRVILIDSPNNPTGVIYPESFLRSLDELITRAEEKFGHYIYLLSDEPYAGLAYDGVTVPSVLKNVRHSIVGTSHSKDLGLAGERIGYIAFSPRIDDVQQLFNACALHTRTLGFINAPAVMQRVVAEFQGEVAGLADYEARRNLLYQELRGMGYQLVKPAGAFYMFPESPIPDDGIFISEALKRNLLAVPGYAFAGPGYFRLSFAERTLEDIARSLPVFRELATQ